MSRWIVSPDEQGERMLADGRRAARPARSSRRGRARGRSAPVAAGAPMPSSQRSTRVTPRLAPTGGSSRGSRRPASGVTSPLCQTSSAARSNRCSLKRRARPNSVRSGVATRSPSGRASTSRPSTIPGGPHEPVRRRDAAAGATPGPRPRSGAVGMPRRPWIAPAVGPLRNAVSPASSWSASARPSNGSPADPASSEHAAVDAVDRAAAARLGRAPRPAHAERRELAAGGDARAGG